jgi:HlyD family secretion protein
VRVYVLRDGQAQPVEVQIGITDGSRTEVKGRDLKENDQIIIGMASNERRDNPSGIANPFQPARPRGVGAFR